jgi:hypothetical protein
MPTIGGFTLSEFSLNLKYLDVGDIAAQMLRQTLQNGKWFIKASTYTNSSITIPSGSNGSQQLLMQIRNTSVKSVFHTFGTAVSTARRTAGTATGFAAGAATAAGAGAAAFRG